MIRYISIILLLTLSSGLFAQKRGSVSSVPPVQKQDTAKVNGVFKTNKQDSVKYTKKTNTHKQDSIKKPRILREWTLSDDYSEEVKLPIDTVFSLSNRFKLADKFSPVNATLGNYGLPFYQLSFFDRITDPDKYLYKSYYPLMHTPSNALFMNTQVPYTELDWSFAGPTETSEQTFRVRHSQNVNRFLNFGVIYDIVFSLGQYNFQRSADKTFTFYSSYTGDKYKAYFSAGINNILSYQNGGVTMTDLATQSATRDIITNLGDLNKANSLLKNKNLLIVQRYTIASEQRAKNDTTSHKKSGFLGLSGTFSHIFILENSGLRYVDAFPTSGFYSQILITPYATQDSVTSKSIKNTVRFDFTTNEARKFRLGGGVGIRNEIATYSYVNPVPFPTPGSNVILHKSSNAVVGKLYNSIGDKFSWLATGELYVTGYRLGDFNLDGEISKFFDFKKGRANWLIDGSIKNTQPSIWYEHWGGNNFEWNDNFSKEFRIDLGSTFNYPARKTELKVNYAIIKNYTDFDSTRYPSQYSGALSVASLTIKNELRVWKFHLASDVIIQKSSNANILDLPLVTIRSAGYFEHLFRFVKTGGKLNMQFGVDVTYNTLYHPYDYTPATGVFFRQELITAGNYPYANVFLNFKVKRTRIFVMFDHVNSKLMGQSIRYNYYMVPDYPMNIRMLRYGFSWTFYD
jgi:hypothetical protein